MDATETEEKPKPLDWECPYCKYRVPAIKMELIRFDAPCRCGARYSDYNRTRPLPCPKS